MKLQNVVKFHVSCQKSEILQILSLLSKLCKVWAKKNTKGWYFMTLNSDEKLY